MPTLDAAGWCIGTAASFLAGLVSFGTYRIWNDRKTGIGEERLQNLQGALEKRGLDLADTQRQLALSKASAIQNGKLAVLGRMSASMAHEIKNPLNFLINIIPEVRRDLDALSKVRELAIPAIRDARVLELIGRVERETDLVQHLDEMEYVFVRIQKALDNSVHIASGITNFSRPAEPDMLAAHNVADMVASVIEMIPGGFRRDIRIVNAIPDGLNWTSNRNEVERAFMTLVNNAIDAMGQKGCLEIGVDADAEPDSATITFRDDGPGIPADVLPNIFQPFVTTKPAGQGTGLGLSIASELVEKNGGQLTVESKYGKGATFRIRFVMAPGSILHHDVMKKYENASRTLT